MDRVPQSGNIRLNLMKIDLINQICIVPQARHVGGPASFQDKFTEGLKKHGISVTKNLNSFAYDAVLVIGGTRHFGGLWRAKQRGIQIVQRLNGMNWLHK
ncbi:MAG: hypothetical protein N2D54_03450, partial [Chloroflexota bacterium]